LEGTRVTKLFELAKKAYEARNLRIPTGTLNNLFVRDIAERWASANQAQKLDIRYITQIGIKPPKFLVFTGGKKPLHFSTRRFLVNQLRENFDFYAAPLRIEQRLKSKFKDRGNVSENY
jgi:GTP-binding protein